MTELRALLFPNFAPDAGRRKQSQMSNVRRRDHSLIATPIQCASLRGEDHVGVERRIVR